MRIKRLLSFLLLLLLVVTTLSAENNEAREYRTNVGRFDKLNVNCSVPVEYKCDAEFAGTVVFVADNYVASNILFSNNAKGTLSIDFDFDFDPMLHKVPNIVVYSETLEKIVNSGDSLVSVSGLPEVENFSATLIGNGSLDIDNIQTKKFEGALKSGRGTITVSGRCEDAKLMILGTGNVYANELQAVNCTAQIGGTGTITCDVSNILKIQGMGSGRVRYVKLPAQIRSRCLGIKHGLILE